MARRDFHGPPLGALAGALFYGVAQDDGFPVSDPNILATGNLNWTGSTGDGTGVATDQTGTGTSYRYNWPCCGGNITDFFQVKLPGQGEVGRTGVVASAAAPGFLVNGLKREQLIAMNSMILHELFFDGLGDASERTGTVVA